MSKIAVMGYGTVGSGVVEVLDMNKDLIASNAGEEVEVKYILDLREFPGDPFEDKIVHDVDLIMEDPEVSVVVETMGGTGAAYTFVKRALENGKSVCTSNKNLIAAFGSELLAIAREKNVRLLFEAAVGGGIPIIRSVNEALTADKIDCVTGILNGTCNYILTKMAREGAEFDAALKEAQENGFAEADPASDIEGHDSCRKIAIMASLISGKNVDFENIHTEGIDKITAEDFKYADSLGMKIKLFSECIYEDGKLKAITAPFIIDRDHPLYGIDGVINAVCVHGNAVGDLVFQGAGAGKLPTASAVTADIVDAVKNKEASHKLLWDATQLKPEDAKKYSYRYFIRVNEADKEKAADIFKDCEFVKAAGVDSEIGAFTSEMTQEEFETAASSLELISFIRLSDTK